MALVDLVRATTLDITHNTSILYNVLRDLIKGVNDNSMKINAASYGAVGDWNGTTKVGTDSTAMLQAAINALAAVPSPVKAGYRVLWLPEGSFFAKNLVVPASMEYGFALRGPGRDASALYIRPDDLSTPGIDCQIEFTSIDGISLYGGKSITSDINDRCQILWRTKLPDGRADCDFKLGEDTRVLGANTLFQMHGRGFIANNVMSGVCTRFLDVAGGAMTWSTSNTYQNGVWTGMRDYSITNSRFDNAGVIMSISVIGPQKDYMNAINICGNDLFACGKILSAPDAVVQYSKFDGNIGVGMYNVAELGAGATVVCRRMINSSVSSNVLANWYNRSQNPDSLLRYFYGLVNITEGAESCNFDANITPYALDFTVKVGGGSRDVSVSRNVLFQPGFVVSAQSANFVMFRGANCIKLIMNDNRIHQVGATDPQSVRLFDPAVQSGEVEARGNQSNISLGIIGGSYSPVCTYGASTVTPGSVSPSVRSSDGYVTLRMQIALPVVGGTASDEVAITLPFSAVAESAASGMYAGYGSAVLAGTSTFSLQGARVYVAQQQIFFIKADGTTMKRGDIVTPVVVSFEVKYRHL